MKTLQDENAVLRQDFSSESARCTALEVGDMDSPLHLFPPIKQTAFSFPVDLLCFRDISRSFNSVPFSFLSQEVVGSLRAELEAKDEELIRVNTAIPKDDLTPEDRSDRYPPGLRALSPLGEPTGIQLVIDDFTSLRRRARVH